MAGIAISNVRVNARRLSCLPVICEFVGISEGTGSELSVDFSEVSCSDIKYLLLCSEQMVHSSIVERSASMHKAQDIGLACRHISVVIVPDSQQK